MNVVFLQNILTSYRIDLFNEIDSQVRKKNGVFEAYYFQESRPGRYLPFDVTKIRFAYKIFKGLRFKVRGRFFHFNPSLIVDVARKGRNTKVIMGSSWNDINVVVLAFLKRLKLVKPCLYIWVEANYMVKGDVRVSSFKRLCRKLVINSIDGGLVIPGEIAFRTVREHWLIDSPVSYLPNLLDGSEFDVARSSPSTSELTCVTVARLNEEDKGLTNFIRKDIENRLKNFTWLIAGDGPDLDIIKEAVAEKSLSDRVKFLGNIPKSEIKSLYSSADVFLLPSFSDPNPISVIEALHAGLPMLISRRCGNVLEAVDERKNGVSFDPYDDESVGEALQFFLDNRSLIEEMGKASKKIAGEEFGIESRVMKFVDSITLENNPTRIES